MKIFAKLSNLRQLIFRAGFISLLLFFGVLMLSQEVYAAEDFEAELVSQNVTELNIAEGRSYSIEARFKNIGTVEWRNDGAHYIALNVSSPGGRTSDFRHESWREDYRPAVMREPVVAPNEEATFRFIVQAPSVAMESREAFNLVAEHLTWIPGGEVAINVRVGNPRPHFASTDVEAPSVINLTQGGVANVAVRVRNDGVVDWHNTGPHFIAMNVTNPVARVSEFQGGWMEWYRPAKMDEEVVRPGSYASFRMRLVAPKQTGVFHETFQLVSEHLTWIEGSEFTLTINIPPEPVRISQDQPMDLRVGVVELDLAANETSATIRVDQDAVVYSGDGARVAWPPNDREMTLSYVDGVYTFNDGATTFTSSTYFRIVPENTWDAVTTILSKDSTYNEYRGITEFRYADEAEELWVINELPLELYLRGLGETSNSSHAEYQKALVTAARTYALFLYNSGTKHAARNFHMTNTAGDQVYLGYVFETLTPNITAAVEATEGYVVTYDGEIALTSYFSQSDGRTRSAEEAWGGTNYPYLISVDDPCCSGELLLGHGVGLSAVGALWFATEQEREWYWILNYYYPTTFLQTIY